MPRTLVRAFDSYTSTDGGNTWTRPPPAQRRSCRPASYATTPGGDVPLFKSGSTTTYAQTLNQVLGNPRAAPTAAPAATTSSGNWTATRPMPRASRTPRGPAALRRFGRRRTTRQCQLSGQWLAALQRLHPRARAITARPSSFGRPIRAHTDRSSFRHHPDRITSLCLGYQRDGLRPIRCRNIWSAPGKAMAWARDPPV